MPRPVEALPCGSRSTISTSSPIAASAVPRLMAVVVLPTPPFWFASAMTRGDFGSATVNPPLTLTLPYRWPLPDVPDFQDPAVRIDSAWMFYQIEVERESRFGDFGSVAAALRKQRRCAAREQRRGELHQARKRRDRTRGDAIDRRLPVGENCLGASLVDRRGRSGLPDRLAQEGAFAPVALDQVDLGSRRSEEGDHDPGQSGAAANIHPPARPRHKPG